MSVKAVSSLLRAGLALACCAAVVGCSGLPSLGQPGDGGFAARDQSTPPKGAIDRVVAGTSTKADVVAALGNAITIRFDSGFEVWVYRFKGSGNARSARTEFVVLFAPSGVVLKTRIRPPQGNPGN